MIIATNTNVCRNLVLLAPGSGSLRQCGKLAIVWQQEDGTTIPSAPRCGEHTFELGRLIINPPTGTVVNFTTRP